MLIPKHVVTLKCCALHCKDWSLTFITQTFLESCGKPEDFLEKHTFLSVLIVLKVYSGLSNRRFDSRTCLQNLKLKYCPKAEDISFIFHRKPSRKLCFGVINASTKPSLNILMLLFYVRSPKWIQVRSGQSGPALVEPASSFCLGHRCISLFQIRLKTFLFDKSSHSGWLGWLNQPFNHAATGLVTREHPMMFPHFFTTQVYIQYVQLCTPYAIISLFFHCRYP